MHFSKPLSPFTISFVEVEIANHTVKPVEFECFCSQSSIPFDALGNNNFDSSFSFGLEVIKV